MIFIQLVALAVTALLLIGSIFTYNALNKTYYIDYTEGSTIDYRVQVKSNDFYDEEWLPDGQSYVSDLMGLLEAKFDYHLNMAAKNVDFDYSYQIDAEYIVIDKGSNANIMKKTIPLKEPVRLSQSSNSQLVISELVTVDYASFNDYVSEFIDFYELPNTTAYLDVRMTVDVIGSSEEFEADSENRYTTSLHVPLNTPTVNIEYSSSLNDGEGKVLACKDASGVAVVKVISFVLGAILLLLGVLLLAFIYLTRNHDVTYAGRVRRVFNNYRSFIQRIVNGFDTQGYQILVVGSFREMLSIRDTIQSPVLMSENTDKTKTQFFIPTNTKILYLFEIRVDNYDDIYGKDGYTDDSVITLPVEESSEEASPVIEETAPTAVTLTEEAISKAVESVVKESTPRVVADAIREATLHAAKMENVRWQGITSEQGFKCPIEQPVVSARDDGASEALLRLADKLIERLEALGAVEKTDVAPIEPASESLLEESKVASDPSDVAIVISDQVVNDEIIEDVAEAIATELDAATVTDSDDDSEGGDEVIVETDEFGNKILIHFSRSVSARVIQSSDTVKDYYSRIKNHILSYKTVKCRTSWKYESYNKGRAQLLKLKIRGKTLLLYCALDPNNYEYSKYFHETAEAKIYSQVPMLVRIKSERGLKRAMSLVDDVMTKFGIVTDAKAETVDYVAENPYESTRALIDRQLIKILSEQAVIPDDERPVRAFAAKTVTVKATDEELLSGSATDDSVRELTDAVIDSALLDSDEEGSKEWQSSGIKISRSFVAKLTQLDGVTRGYYNELKNHILSYKGVKDRISWKCETYKWNKEQLIKLKLRGKMILLHVALDPSEDDYSAYNYEVVDSKAYERVPMMIKIKGERGLDKAKQLIDLLMAKYGASLSDKSQNKDFTADYPFESSEALMDKGLIKIMVDDKEFKVDDRNGLTVAAIAKALAAGDPSLSDMKFADRPDPDFKGNEKNPATEVVSVFIPEKNDKVYRYDPDGEALERGDVVIVPAKSNGGKKKIAYKAAVTEGNHGVDSKKLEGPVEKILGVVKRKIEEMLTK